MTYKDVTYDAVIAAMREYDDRGQDEFLEEYRYHPAREDIMRGLMTSATSDLFASPAAAAAAIRGQRRRQLRGRLLGAAGTAAAAGVAAGTIVATSGSHAAVRPAAKGAHHATGSPVTVHLTAAQKTLFGLSAAALKTPRPAGLYVVLSEKSYDTDADGSENGPKTSVINTKTGGGVEYQDITVTGEAGVPQPPAQATAADGTSPTIAQLDALPTDTAALWANLLATATEQLDQAEKLSEQRMAKAGKLTGPVPVSKEPQPTDDDLVFEQATDLLWEPHLSPALRSALYKVLAGTSGVVVDSNATDSAGQAAVEISRVDTVGKTDVETFEDAATGATLESAWTYGDGSFSEDLYLKTTYTNTIPSDPYQG